MDVTPHRCQCGVTRANRTSCSTSNIFLDVCKYFAVEFLVLVTHFGGGLTVIPTPCHIWFLATEMAMVKAVMGHQGRVEWGIVFLCSWFSFCRLAGWRVWCGSTPSHLWIVFSGRIKGTGDTAFPCQTVPLTTVHRITNLCKALITSLSRCARLSYNSKSLTWRLLAPGATGLQPGL